MLASKGASAEVNGYKRNHRAKVKAAVGVYGWEVLIVRYMLYGCNNTEEQLNIRRMALGTACRTPLAETQSYLRSRQRDKEYNTLMKNRRMLDKWL